MRYAYYLEQTEKRDADGKVVRECKVFYPPLNVAMLHVPEEEQPGFPITPTVFYEAPQKICDEDIKWAHREHIEKADLSLSEVLVVYPFQQG